MPTNSANAQTGRDALTTLLRAALTGSANPVQAAFGYDLATFQDQSPVIIVRSGKVDRTTVFLGAGKPHVWFFYEIDVYVAVGDAQSPTWTDQNVEDTHDLIEKMINDTLTDNRRTANWDSAQYAQPASAPSPKVISGRKYRLRTIYVKARVIYG